MSFAYRKFDVYKMALKFVSFSNEIIASLPRGNSNLVDQLSRAATSIVLNIAEGAGKMHKADKRRYYLSAHGSIWECAAILDLLQTHGLLTEEKHAEGNEMLERMGAMMTGLSKAMMETSE